VLTSAPAAAAEITHTTLSNGMEIVVIPDHRAPVVTHMVWYKVGASDEPVGKSGIAHFLEHLMFKGTQKIQPGEFSKIVARNGGQDNAFTTQDATAYFQRVATDRLPLVMEMEADRMANLRLLEEDVNNERKVILEERRSRVDNDPSSILQEQVGAVLFLAHPYRIPTIGWEHEMRTLNRDDALAFYKRYYAPDNAILVVAGDVEPEAVIKMAKETYGKLPPAGGLKPRLRVKEPEPQAPRRVSLKDDRVAKSTLSRHYLTPCYVTATGHEAEALELLSSIVGSNSTGRLFKKLVVEDKLASVSGGWYAGDNLDYGRLGFYAVAAGDVPLAKIEAAMDAVLAEVRENGVTSAELERARNAQLAEFVYSEDSQVNQARTYGWALVTGRTIEDMKNRSKRFEQVTLDDIKTVARKYLEAKRSVTGELIAGNKAFADNGPVQPPAPSGTIH
jgi:zinc protease